jgi:hypothetical protein
MAPPVIGQRFRVDAPNAAPHQCAVIEVTAVSRGSFGYVVIRGGPIPGNGKPIGPYLRAVGPEVAEA